MRTALFASCVMCVLAVGLPAAADNFSWTFQRTAFRSTSSIPQTAISMRANLSTPVVYGIDQGMLNAYSLFPFANPGPVPVLGQPPTNWHQIGSNLTKTFVPSSNVFLQAASGAPDAFGVSMQTPQLTSQPFDATVIGNSLSGFQAPQNNTQALKFDADGQPFVAATTMIPLTQGQSSDKLYDVALSPFGDVGAVTQAGTTGPTTYWQRSALLGGQWFPQTLTPTGENTLYGPSVDLLFDASARPHVLGINRFTSSNSIVAYRFDIPSGTWQFNTLDASFNAPPIADVAAASNDEGIVGAAWVNNGVLKYAFLDTNEVAPQWVVTTVASTIPSTTPGNRLLEPLQGVGLAYDQAGLPVISFVERSSREIWIAYDPPLLTTPSTQGDFNDDGAVDAVDLADWSANFGDGGADGGSFLAWQQNFGAGITQAGAAAVPEPAATSVILIATAGVGVTAVRHRRAGPHRMHCRSRNQESGVRSQLAKITRMDGALIG